MSLKELISVVSPPARSATADGKVDWDSIEKELGACFPDDYKQFAMTYGSGGFLDPERLRIYTRHPFDDEYKEFVAIERIRYEHYVKRVDEPFPHSIYPASPGLLPWCKDDNGCVVYWLTKGVPNKWPVVARDPDYHYQELKLTATTFLAKAFARQIDCILWPEPFFTGPDKVVFVPSKSK